VLDATDDSVDVGDDDDGDDDDSGGVITGGGCDECESSVGSGRASGLLALIPLAMLAARRRRTSTS